MTQEEIQAMSKTIQQLRKENKELLDRVNVLFHAWQDAQGDNLPPIDKEVIVLCQDYPEDPEHLRVAYGHRPNPEGWTGKNIITGEVKHHIPQIYDKGGWNIPNVKYYLDIELPNK